MPTIFFLIFFAVFAALEASATNSLQELELLASETSRAHSELAKPVVIWRGEASQQKVCGFNCQTSNSHLSHKKSKLSGEIELYDMPWNNVDYTTPYGATFYVYITDADFDCREQLFGDGGFQSCTIYIRYYYESNYNGNDTPNVHVTCQAQIRTTPSEGWSRSRSSSASNSHYARYDSGSLEIYFSLNSFYDPIVSAKVLDYDCYIESVY